jgi:subtilisin family serine protease
MRLSLRRTALELLAVVVVATCVLGPTVAGAAPSTTQVLVKFKSNASQQARDSLLGSYHAKQVGTVRDLGIKVVSVPAASARATVGAMRGNSLVSFAEPNAIFKPQDNLPSDPSFPTSFGLAGGAWGWPMTHTTQAWDVTHGNPNVVIAILDTGIKTAGLSDFDGQIASTYNAMTGTNDVTSNAGNHGTYVAGIAGLAMDNATGNAGFCPGCRLMIVQVGTDTGATLSDIANGLTYAADHGANVSNMSWAGTTDSATLRAATTYAHQHGVVMTAAAGNSNCNCVTYPADDPYVLGVAGVDSSGSKTGDSNYGSWVPLAAPEGDMTAWPSINGSPGYAPVGGTSSAAPVVAGIAGLLFSANPALSDTQVEQALESTAVPVGFSLGYGRVDALAALQSLGFNDPQAASAPVNVSGPQLFVETNGNYGYEPLAGAPQVGQVLLRGQGSWTGSAPLSLSALQWQRCSTGSDCSTVGTGATYTVQSADSGYSLRLIVTVKNGLGSTAVISPFSAPVGGTTTTTTPTPPPTDSTPPSISGTPQVGQALNAATGSWTGSPTGYAYQWQDCNGSGGGCVAIAGATSSSYTAQSSDVGDTLRVAVTATNSGGSATASSAATAAVAAPPPPPPATQTSTFSGSLNSKSPSRSFAVTVGPGSASAQLSFSRCTALSLGLSNGSSAKGPSVLSLNTTLSAGSYTYTVSGGKCSFTLTVVSASP